MPNSLMPHVSDVQAHYDLSDEVYRRYMRYPRGCRHYFSDQMLDVNLVTYVKPQA